VALMVGGACIAILSAHGESTSEVAASVIAVVTRIAHGLAVGILPLSVLHTMAGILRPPHLSRSAVRAGDVACLALAAALSPLSAHPGHVPPRVVAVAVLASGVVPLAALWHAEPRPTAAWHRWCWSMAGLLCLTLLATVVILAAVLDGRDPPADVLLSTTLLIPAVQTAAAAERVAPGGPLMLRFAARSVGVGLAAGVGVGLVLLVNGPPPIEGIATTTMIKWSADAAVLGALANMPIQGQLAALGARRQTPAEVLDVLMGRLSRAVPWDEALLGLVDTLVTTMRLSSAQVYLGAEGRYLCAASLPERGPEMLVTAQHDVGGAKLRPGAHGAAWASVWVPALAAASGRDMRVVPLFASGQLLGFLVAERADADRFTASDDALLEHVAAQVATAAHNVQLGLTLEERMQEISRQATELQASRRRIVVAADAERRRIERDLHDGAQQALLFLVVALQRAQHEIADMGVRVPPTLDVAVRQALDIHSDLRSLAHGIYPPALRDSGLRDALRAAAARSAESGTDIDVDVSVGRYDPDVEAAVYFCCLEALLNAVKHGGPDVHVMLRIHEADEALVFEVVDDGHGFDPVLGSGGQGLANMRDRLGALGGTLTISASAGEGTRVRGTLPLPPPST
jgi:signal transduction histidine kinase